MPNVIQILGFTNGAECPQADQYCQEFDHDALKGKGFGNFTPNPHLAKKFNTAGEALEFWRKQSTINPIRADGQPNRPFTAASVCILPLDEAIEDAKKRGTPLTVQDSRERKK